jgi:GST-like protein
VLGNVYDATEFLGTDSYTHVNRWAKKIKARTAVKRGRCVNRAFGAEDKQLKERHSARDIDALM